MAKIAVLRQPHSFENFDGEQYIVDTNRKFGGYEAGDIICSECPFFGIPLRLEIAIRKNGELVFRSWTFILPDSTGGGNGYLHTQMSELEKSQFKATEEQINTVSGLFSGRIKFEGIKLSPGATLQAICPIDVAAEENRIGKTIFLA